MCTRYLKAIFRQILLLGTGSIAVFGAVDYVRLKFLDTRRESIISDAKAAASDIFSVNLFGNCAYCAIDTLAKMYNIDGLMGLSDKYKDASSISVLKAILQFKAPGRTTIVEDIQSDDPIVSDLIDSHTAFMAVINLLPNRHAVVVLEMNDDSVTIIDNACRPYRAHTVSRQYFDSVWGGTILIVWP